MILGSAWLLAVAFGLPLWRRSTIDAAGRGGRPGRDGQPAGGRRDRHPGGGAGALVDVALGLNLREDRGCGRLRAEGDACRRSGWRWVWRALLGTFTGAISPFWKSEEAIEEVQDALSTRPPRFERRRPPGPRLQADRYSTRPWLYVAHLRYLEWIARGARPDDRRWRMVLVDLGKATDPPRNPNGWALHRERAMVTRELLGRLPTLKPGELMAIRASVVEATRKATLLYPTNASLHAWLADASTAIGVFPDAFAPRRKGAPARRPHAAPGSQAAEGPRVAGSKGDSPTWEATAARRTPRQPQSRDRRAVRTGSATPAATIGLSR